MEVTPTVALSALAAVVTAAAAHNAWTHRDGPGGRPAVAYLVATALWSAFLTGEMAATTLEGKLFWLNLQYLPVAVVPVAAAVFVAEYLGYDGWVTRRRVAALAAPLVALALFSWTNDYHGLVRTSVDLVTFGGSVWLAREFGPVWWLGWLYSQALITATFLGLAYGVWNSSGKYRLQVAVLFVGAGTPWLAQFPMFVGGPAIRPELLFSVTGFAFLAAIRWAGFLEVAPVARERVVESLSDPILVFDSRDRLVDTNDAAASWFTDVATGTSADAVFDAVPAVLEAYHTGTSRPDPVELRPGDTRRYATVMIEELPSVGNRGVGSVVVLRDVTRLKRREDELEAANDRLETLANAIAHDLRNPLSVAQGYHELAREGDETAHEKVANAHRRMGEIIDETLAAAVDRPVADVEPVSVASLATAAWETVDTADATLDVRGDVTVDGSPGKLRGFFENLFRNSVEYAGSNTTVTVAAANGGFVVADDGPGIPPADRESVFERGFSRRGTAGSGIGLAVVRETIEDHGWTLGVTESTAGGAAFVVAFGYASVSTVAADSEVVADDAPITVVTRDAPDAPVTESEPSEGDGKEAEPEREPEREL